MKQLLCFDLDGTLIQSDNVHVEAFNEAFIKNNLKPVKSPIIKRLLGRKGELIIKSIFPKLSEKKIKQIRLDHNKLIVNKYYKIVKPIKNIVNNLKRLKNKFNLAVISNCTHKEIIMLLKGAKINPKLFDLIIGDDDVKHAKPAPDEILKAEKLMHVKGACIIGDTIFDIKAGKRAKATTIAVLTGIHKKEKLKKHNPDYLLRDISKIPLDIKC